MKVLPIAFPKEMPKRERRKCQYLLYDGEDCRASKPKPKVERRSGKDRRRS